MRPPLPDLSIRQLEYLVAVADAPTWADAAGVVGVSPSALSQGLAELERRLGVALFERAGRRRRLRAAAQPVLDHARQVLGLTGDLASWAERVRTAAVGRVRVGMIDAAAVVHFPEVLRTFRTAHPEVDLRLTVAPSAALLRQLVGGELDMVICAEPRTPLAGVDIERVLDEPLAVYHSMRAGSDDPRRWGPWVLFPTGSHTREVIVDALRGLGAPLEIVAESHQPEVLAEMVRLGMGWTVLPESQGGAGGPMLVRGRRIATRTLVIAHRAGAVRDPAVEKLADDVRAR